MSLIATDEIKQRIANGEFEYLKGTDNHKRSREMEIILEKKGGDEVLDKLREFGVINDKDIYYHMTVLHPKELTLNTNEYQSDNAKLFAILKRHPRDGSLVIDDSEVIWHLACEYNLPVIEAWQEIGVTLDHNALLAMTFAGDHGAEYELFDFLINQYPEFSQQALASSSAIILSGDHWSQNEEQYRVINTLFKKGADLNTCFDENIQWSNWNMDYISLFWVFMTHEPELILTHPLISDDFVPSELTYKDIDWEFIVGENDFGQAHITTLKALMQRGATFPLDDIADALQENDMPEYAQSVRALANSVEK